MGTKFREGEKPQNRVTISKGGEAPARQVDPDSGKIDRSFAQPNPAMPAREVEPKAHANAQEEVESLNKNSVEGRDYTQQDDESGGE